jgi:hypothetical protein
MHVMSGLHLLDAIHLQSTDKTSKPVGTNASIELEDISLGSSISVIPAGRPN